MTRQDWLGACLMAVVVAALTVSMSALPLCWAAGKAPVAVPALPPSKLTIPSIKAQVSATAIPPSQPVKTLVSLLPDSLADTKVVPASWRGVKVQLQVKMPKESRVAQVPVTVTVYRSTNNPMARSLPMPEQVAKIDASVAINANGEGAKVVELPLVWAEPPPTPAAEKPTAKNTKPAPMKTVTSFQMVLSSTLGGRPAPAGLVILREALPAKAS